jgi:hypothetical protein
MIMEPVLNFTIYFMVAGLKQKPIKSMRNVRSIAATTHNTSAITESGFGLLTGFGCLFTVFIVSEMIV